MPSVGSNIREARARAGMTQQEVAEATGLLTTRISDLERDRYRMPDTSTLQKIASATGATLESLLYGVEEIYLAQVVTSPVFRSIYKALKPLRHTDIDRYRIANAHYLRAGTRAATLLQEFDWLTANLDLGENAASATLSDLVRHDSAVQRTSHQQGESDVPASARIRELEERLAAYEQLAPEIDSVLTKLASLAADAPATRPALRDQTKRRRRDRKAS